MAPWQPEHHRLSRLALSDCRLRKLRHAPSQPTGVARSWNTCCLSYERGALRIEHALSPSIPSACSHRSKMSTKVPNYPCANDRVVRGCRWIQWRKAFCRRNRYNIPQQAYGKKGGAIHSRCLYEYTGVSRRVASPLGCTGHSHDGLRVSICRSRCG
ncbi:uncharacterized protein LY79DRAFT_536062 [Colletotrichum navitas]|uniref:Uncharacterized protein n=1 Tax=Colletotrichum navitas TaxID=681940 RepID=A0AAD8QER2_9PEZI|nr:uncharacterized protein LY79DRAFT_536062 [Colletotrichum navitas]KAK1599774.1 hypothetical protein LY79DRAFT_536062 [Colletotrichum navitas]